MRGRRCTDVALRGISRPGARDGFAIRALQKAPSDEANDERAPEEQRGFATSERLQVRRQVAERMIVAEVKKTFDAEAAVLRDLATLV